MATMEKRRFKGFSPETFKFLRSLKANNNKIWFESHRADYEKYLLQPLRDLVVNLGEFMLTIDPDFEITPAVNKTISRIYRDTRFSSDKSLFKTAMWIAFNRPGVDWKDDPGYFFEISTNRCRYGMGFYSALAETMSKFREVIDENPKEALKLISLYSKQRIFSVEGKKYKRIFDGSKPERIQDWYQRRNLYLICTRKIDGRLLSSRLVDNLKTDFKLAAPLYRFLRKVKRRIVNGQDLSYSEAVRCSILRQPHR
jgi:uncharacterized protein (TIGR02453 family)